MNQLQAVPSIRKKGHEYRSWAKNCRHQRRSTAVEYYSSNAPIAAGIQQHHSSSRSAIPRWIRWIRLLHGGMLLTALLGARNEHTRTCSRKRVSCKLFGTLSSRGRFRAESASGRACGKKLLKKKKTKKKRLNTPAVASCEYDHLND